VKKIYLCTSWKMNLSVTESLEYANKLNNLINEIIPANSLIEVYIFPDFLSLYPISLALSKSRIKLGAQDCFWEDTGPYTGEISPRSLKAMGCDYVMAGHPERVNYFKEDAAVINKKVKAILRNNMTPTLFVVEKEKKPEIKDTCNILKDQLFPLLEGIEKKDLGKIVIFYEPAWAIGTSSAAPVDHTRSILAALREAIDNEYGKGTGTKQIFMYGGGVTLESAKSIMELDNIDGVGMGKAALNFDFFAGAIKAAVEIEKKLKKI
jgi:triosephosphate isomerase (TIM)